MQILGEDAAAGFLAGRGLRILARNWATKMGEIDIVALDGSTVVFVEVKTRFRDTFVAPELCVDHRKQTRLRKTAEAFLQKASPAALSPGGGPAECRFDVISVVAGCRPAAIRHIINAF